jgi:hypothetical protein
MIWITYDRDRQGLGEILLAKFREKDVVAGKSMSGAVTLKQTINKLDKPKLVSANWDAALTNDIVMLRLVNICQSGQPEYSVVQQTLISTSPP